MAALVAAIVFLVCLIRLSAAVSDPGLPVEGKVALWAAAIYAVFPTDALPAVLSRQGREALPL
ncbi:MAG TPA: hypothetical protein VLL08_20135 [Kineosporiaceae bacterium]|nr:hypothetical protein [Kineosporiaceae bacterium]